MQANAEVTLKKVTVAGNSRTSLSFFDAEFNDLKKSGVTLQETVNGLHQKTQQLLSTDMFEAVDTNLVVLSQENGKVVADVNVNVKEKGIPFLNVASYVKAGASAEAGFEVRGALRNPIGYGETVRLSNVTTQTGAREYQAAVSIPNVGPQRFNLNVTARSATEDQSYYTSFKQQVDGVTVELNTRDGMHQLVAEYALRDEIPVTSTPPAVPTLGTLDEKALPGFNLFSLPTLPASAVTANTAMTSLKTSLKYLCTALDTRDNMANPSSGSYLQGSVEVAAPPGTTVFCAAADCLQISHFVSPQVMSSSIWTALYLFI
jgi:outer membrane protein assembly factor BamA